MRPTASERVVWLGAAELARAIREREVSAVEVLEAILSRIERWNPQLNAVVTLDPEGARRQAEAADRALAHGEVWGPLHGVPITIKDTLSTRGMRTTAGWPGLAGHVPTEDATVVARLRAAGAIVLGKTNVPELAFDWQSSNPLFGRTNNPWDVTRTAGGSSGGAAAAVAAGFSPLDIGSDLGGSIRVPAHFCGVFGLKPTDQRVSRFGHIPRLPGRPRAVRWMSHMGPLARTVEDLELALRLIAGPDGRVFEVPPVPLGDSPSDRPLRSFRIAWADGAPDVLPAGAIRKVLVELVDRLEESGCSVRQCSLERLEFLRAAWLGWAELLLIQLSGSMPPDEFADFIQAKGFLPDADDPARSAASRLIAPLYRDLVQVLELRDQCIAQMEELLDQNDLFLWPVSATPAFPHCEFGTPIAVDGREIPYFTAVSAFAAPLNFTGHPVVVVPMGLSAEGLPVGVQVVGRRWGEIELLAAVRQLVELIPPLPRPALR